MDPVMVAELGTNNDPRWDRDQRCGVTLVRDGSWQAQKMLRREGG